LVAMNRLSTPVLTGGRGVTSAGWKFHSQTVLRWSFFCVPGATCFLASAPEIAPSYEG
jgi:hypothetical protein